MKECKREYLRIHEHYCFIKDRFRRGPRRSKGKRSRKRK